MSETWQTVTSGTWVEEDPAKIRIEILTETTQLVGMVMTDGRPAVYLPYVDIRCPYVPESLSYSGDTMPDLPIHGWIWYDESDQIDTSTEENQS